MNRQAVQMIGIWAGCLVVLSMVIPAILVGFLQMSAVDDGRDRFGAARQSVSSESSSGSRSDSLANETGLIVPVYLTSEQTTVQVPLEHYVRGVVAAEMPPEFEPEALKAQAIAARTYIWRRAVDSDFSDVPATDAWVTDSVMHQAFLPIEQIQVRWGTERFEAHWDKVTAAVRETSGQVVTYGGEPIQAAFFSTSNGYTENSEEYWQDAIPYLRSVPSPWDAELSPRYRQTFRFQPQYFYERLGLPSAPPDTGDLELQVLDKTAGGRVKTARIAGEQFSGRQIREKLELPSSHFDFRMADGNVEVTTYGYGHGVGMSQYGAQGMALEGRTALEILQYFYPGVEIETLQPHELESA